MSRKINQCAKVDTMEFHNAHTPEGKLIITDINIHLPETLLHGSKSTSVQKKAVMLHRNNRLQAIRIIPKENSQVGEVYIGKIKNITTHPEACFIEISGKQTCFLPLSEAKTPLILNRQGAIQLKAGDELLVQIIKDAQKNKLCTCSTNISLSTDYVALSTAATSKYDSCTDNTKTESCEMLAKVNYSGKLSSEKKQTVRDYIKLHAMDLLKEISSFTKEGQDFPIPDAVIRTKSEELSPEQIYQNLLAAYKEYGTMLQIATTRTCFTCIRSIPRTHEQLLQDVALPEEYSEIITDDVEIYDYLTEYLAHHQTNPTHTIRLYEDRLLSLNRLYGLDAKIEEALGRRIWLKSGANLIIEPTEAMTVIDVNSAKKDAYKAGLDEASQINREAATEIALQLRLRNLSGIIIVDFINMKDKEQEKYLLTHMREAVSTDPVKTKVIDMTPLGLAEITRKKVHKPLSEQIMS